MRRLLIAGAGHAALACIEQLSKLKHQFSITVLGGPPRPEPRPCAESEEAQLVKPASETLGPEKLNMDKLSMDKLGLGMDKPGIELRADVCVEAIDRHAKVVRGCDGSRTTFDTLILAADSANPGLARAAGLEVRTGVLLNDVLQTSDAHVYALGDGAEHCGSIYKDPEAIREQARVLAAHISGYVPRPFRGARKARVAGLSGASSALRNLSASLTACAASPASSAAPARRSEVQTPEPEGRSALAGAA